MIAATRDLCERMACLCGHQRLKWEDARASLLGATSCEWRKHRRKYVAPELFISYHRAGAGPEARLLQSAIEEVANGVGWLAAARAQKWVFLDSTDAADLRSLLSALATSKGVVLLLTRLVLERPWVLVELHEAIRCGIPVICVNIAGAGYDYAQASHYLSNLEHELNRCDAGALAELRAQLQRLPQHVEGDGRCTLPWLQKQLADTIPNSIAIPFEPTRATSINYVSAVAAEIIDRAGQLQRSSATSSSRQLSPGRRPKGAHQVGPE